MIFQWYIYFIYTFYSIIYITIFFSFLKLYSNTERKKNYQLINNVIHKFKQTCFRIQNESFRILLHGFYLEFILHVHYTYISACAKDNALVSSKDLRKLPHPITGMVRMSSFKNEVWLGYENRYWILNFCIWNILKY